MQGRIRDSGGVEGGCAVTAAGCGDWYWDGGMREFARGAEGGDCVAGGEDVAGQPLAKAESQRDMAEEVNADGAEWVSGGALVGEDAGDGAEDGFEDWRAGISRG